MQQHSERTSTDLIKKDKAHVWHPFTQMQITSHIPIASAKGEMLYDYDGNAYIDAISSWWVNIHGHCNQYINDAVKAQLDQLEHVIFAGMTHRPAVELSAQLAAVLPGTINKCFFSDDGSTAVEVALKMSLQYWFNKGQRKQKILAFNHAYHGDTFGSMSLSHRDAFNKPFHELLFDVLFVDAPYPGRETAAFEELEVILDEHDDIAAIIFEPLVQGAGGMQMYDPSALDKVIQLCRAKEVLIIADEVMTGFGRTGKIFASDYLSSGPDIICLSKGLTAGYLPLSITACKDFIYEAFLSNSFEQKTFFHGHSYTANPLGCAAALASLELTLSNDTKQKIAFIEAYFKMLGSELAVFPEYQNIRQRGTILAMDLKHSGDYFSGDRDRIYHYFLDKGILARPLGNTIYFMPPYCIEESSLDKLANAVKELPKAI